MVENTVKLHYFTKTIHLTKQNHIFNNFKISVKNGKGRQKENPHFHQFFKISTFLSKYLKIDENSVKLNYFMK